MLFSDTVCICYSEYFFFVLFERLNGDVNVGKLC